MGSPHTTNERTPLFSHPPPPYEDSTKSATPTAGPSSYTLSAHAAPFVPASHLISYQRQPTLHCSMSYTLPPRPRHVTPLGPSPYHSLPPPVSYERAHGLTLADRRARKRFWYALFWGVLLYLAISAVVTVGMQNQEELQREARHAWKGIQRWIKDLENRWDSERLDDRWGPRVEPHHPHTSLVAANAEPVNVPSSSRVDGQDVQ